MAIGDGRLAKRMINVRFDDTANMEPWSHGGGTTLYIYMHVEEPQLHLHCLFAWNICMQQSQGNLPSESHGPGLQIVRHAQSHK